MMTAIATAIFAFAATNIDDIFILILFFANRIDFKKVLVGQLLGILALVIGSYIISLLGYLFDPRYIGLMGFFPIYLGIRQLISVRRNSSEAEAKSPMEKPSALAIAAITIANGGDNIGVYTPLFAGLNALPLLITAIVFLLMVYLWCVIARYLAHHPMMARSLDEWGHLVMPVVLMLLGAYILYESESLTLFL